MAAPRSVVLGVDGSAHSRRAAAFLARLAPPPGGRAAVVSVVEPLRTPSLALLPAGARGRLAAMAAQIERGRLAAAHRHVEAAARRLTAVGWKTRTIVRSGVPLAELLGVLAEEKADLVVLGARGATGLDRLLLGSVSEGVVRRAAIPVVIVK